jgi:predicted DNA-binding transcriptional regulator
MNYSSAEAPTTEQMIALVLIFHQQRYRLSDINKELDIQLSVYDTFLE